MLTAQYQMAPMDGVDFSNPEQTRLYLLSMNESLRIFSDALRREVNQPKHIIVNGKPLDKALKSSLPKRGEIRAFHITWATALSMRGDGWIPADGMNGTLQAHPKPGDSSSVARFLRASSWGVTLSSTGGGCTTHTHGFTTGAGSAHGHTVSVTVAPCGTHDHSGVTGNCYNEHCHGLSAASVQYCELGSGSGCYGTTTTFCHPAWNHTHLLSGLTDTSGGDHSHTIANTGTSHNHAGSSGSAGNESTHTHTGTTDASCGEGASSALPAYAEVIYMEYIG